MGDQTHWLFSPDSVMNSDPHLNSVKKEDEEDSFLDDLDLQDEDMSFSDLSFNMNAGEYAELTEERLLGMSEEELTGMFANQDLTHYTPTTAQQSHSLQLQAQQLQQPAQTQQQVQQLLQQQVLQPQAQVQQVQTLQPQTQTTLQQQVPDVCIIQKAAQQQLHLQQQQQQQQQQSKMVEATTTTASGITVSSDLTNLVALLLGNQQQQANNNVAAAAVSQPAVVSAPPAPAPAPALQPRGQTATASQLIQQLVQKEQQKQQQNKTLAQLALLLQIQQQQPQAQQQPQQQQQTILPQQHQQQLLLPTLQTVTTAAVTQPQLQTQLQQQQQQQQQIATTTLPQQPTTSVQQKVLAPVTVAPVSVPVTVHNTVLPKVQVIKQEQVKPVVTTVPQLVIQTSQHGNVAIVGSTMATTTTTMQTRETRESTTTTSTKIPIAPMSASSPNGGGLFMVKKPEKRKAHNAIEQRYRRSINGRIEDLRCMLFKEDKKVSKSRTLQKAIDHLLGLKKMCQTLKIENRALKEELCKYTGTPLPLPDVKDPLTPPSSYTDSGSEPPSPYSSPVNSPLSPESPMHHSGGGGNTIVQATPVGGAHAVGLLDRTRLVLCVFMFSILAFNPFGFLINKGFESFVVGGFSGGDAGAQMGGGGGGGGGGRRLMGVESEGGFSLIWHLIPTLLIWLVNGTVIATILLTFLYGDKMTKSGSLNTTAFWRYRTQAEQEIAKGNIAQALNQLFRCFAPLGRSHPLTNLEYYASFIWNLICLPLSILFKGRGLGARSSPRSKEDKGEGKYPAAQASARDIALTYHKILQLFLTANFSIGVPRAFYMGLCSINHAERARGAMGRAELAEIYATVGVLIKTRFSRNLQWLATPVFYRVRRLLSKSKNPAPPLLTWTLDAFSQRRFKGDMSIPTASQGQSLFTSASEKSNPLVVLSQHRRETMIQRILQGILTQRGDNKDEAQKKGKSDGDDQEYMLLLNHLSTSLEEATNYYQQSVDVCSNLGTREEYDPLARWWANLLFVAAYWQKGEEEKAEAYFSSIDSLPAELERESFSLAAQQALKARQIFLTMGQHDTPEDCLRMCDMASDNLLHSMDALPSEQNMESVMLVQLLIIDWLLSTRWAIWQRRQGCNTSTHATAASSSSSSSTLTNTPASRGELAAFQRDLTSLRKLASDCDLAHVGSKVTLYEAVGRLMAGANPVRTQVLLDRNLRKRVTDSKHKDTDEEPATPTEHDLAQTLLVKSCYLYSSMPSDQVERKSLLNDAVRSLEKVGDRRGMQSCQQMLQVMQKSGTTQTTNTSITTACC